MPRVRASIQFIIPSALDSEWIMDGRWSHVGSILGSSGIRSRRRRRCRRHRRQHDKLRMWRTKTKKSERLHFRTNILEKVVYF